MYFFNTGEQNINTNCEIDTDKPNPVRVQDLISKLRTDHVESSHEEPILKIITSYHDIFTLDQDPLPCIQSTEHEITLKNDKPINIKSYKPPECHKQEIHKQINEMLGKGIIESSDSPYNTPVWVVPKKIDGTGKQKWRIVIHFRKLNEQIKTLTQTKFFNI